MQAHFNGLKRPPGCFQIANIHSDFLLAPSLAKCSFNGWAIHNKTFYEPPIMAQEAKEGLSLSVSLWWCTLSNGL